jgi:predicted peptidase
MLFYKIEIMKIIYPFLFVLVSCFFSCQEADVSIEKNMEPQLLRISYPSKITEKERDYFVLLPKNYEKDTTKDFPVLLFLHGGGERGNAKKDLDKLLVNGPLYEAWIQNRDLPFIIVAPQMPLFGRADSTMTSLESVPERSNKAPRKPKKWASNTPMTGAIPAPFLPYDKGGLPDGWGVIKEEVMDMLDKTLADYRTNKKQVYLTGLSYGGFGTWILASNYPERFAAIVPVVGWGHPDLMPSIAQAKIPVWCISGGRDNVVQNQFFFAGMNKLEALGHQNIRFTIHEDMEHDVWTRVYGGDDVYNWLLEHELER